MKSIIAKNLGGSDYEPLPLLESGVYVARCYSMVHMGTIPFTYLGEEKEANKVRITWELPNETHDFGEEKGVLPRVISKEFTLSMHEKANLRKFLQAWRGKPFSEEESEKFDITKLIGAVALLNIGQNTSKKGKAYNTVESASKLMKGQECPEQVNPSFVFTVEEFDEVDFGKLPEFIQDQIIQSSEYKAMKSEIFAKKSDPDLDEDDGLPF